MIVGGAPHFRFVHVASEEYVLPMGSIGHSPAVTNIIRHQRYVYFALQNYIISIPPLPVHLTLKFFSTRITYHSIVPVRLPVAASKWEDTFHESRHQTFRDPSAP